MGACLLTKEKKALHLAAASFLELFKQSFSFFCAFYMEFILVTAKGCDFFAIAYDFAFLTFHLIHPRISYIQYC